MATATAITATTVTGVTLTLSTAEAKALSEYLDLDRDPAQFRIANPCLYTIEEALDDALDV